ncbi:MAG TPA: hypothetical protein VLM79_36715 [Kofleriaceae bacterium]|nr:hypothetical protein [Kofleriaceae bacterium]
MRCVVGVGLLALVGCNQLFSLSPTREFDAAISVDVIPDLPHIELTYQIAGVLPSGAPNPAIAFAPLMPKPVVKLAPLLPGKPMEDLAEAEYSSADGWVLIPRSYLEGPWRLEYTVADGVSAPVPHEVQWSPEDKAGHLTVPLSGRLAPATLPVDAGYKVKPNGAGMFNSPEMITTGLWTAGPARSDPTNAATAIYDLVDAVFLSGKKGRPDPALGDRAFLVDFAMPDAQGCRAASGAVTLDSAEAQTGPRMTQVPTATWDTAKKPVKSTALDLSFVTRLQGNLGKLHGAITGDLLFGFAPSLSMPSLAAASPALPLPLPLPVMATVLRCPYSPNPGDARPGTPLPATAQPAGLDRFPQVLHVQLADVRTVLGVPLASGMEVVLAAGPVLPTGPTGFTISFPAAIPGKPMLTTPSKGAIDLAGDSEQLDIGPVRDSLGKPVELQLSFTPEVNTADGVRADYDDILLHRFDGASLTTDRIYTVTAPSVRIDSSVLQPNTTYVLEIRTYKGHPAAARGDFTQIDYPYGAAIMFTRTFKTAP